MPVVIVEMWTGRTAGQKKELAAGITASFEKIGTPKEAVQIIIQDIPQENWAIGGQMASKRTTQK